MKVKDLFVMYQRQRESCLNVDQFSSMLMMYPALLVATADGNFDELEKRNLVSAVQASADDDIFIAFEMYAELAYLRKATVEEKTQIFSCIKDEIAEKKDLQTIILDLMLSSAKASDDISEEEQNMINEIKSLLNI